MIMIIMNMQNKLYRIQFSHHLVTNSQSVPQQRSRTPEITNFAKFLKKEFELPDKRRFKPTEKRRAESFLPPQPTPIHKLSMMSVVWNTPIGQLG